MMNCYRIFLSVALITTQPQFLYAAHGWSGERPLGAGQAREQNPLITTIDIETLSPEEQSTLRSTYNIRPDQSIQEGVAERRKRIDAQKAFAQKNPCTLRESQKKLIVQWLDTLEKTPRLYQPLTRQIFAYLIRMLFGFNAAVIFRSRIDYVQQFIGTEGKAFSYVSIQNIPLEQFTPEQAGLILYFKSILENASSSIDKLSSYDMLSVGPFDKNINQLLDFLGTYGNQPENRDLNLYFRGVTSSIHQEIIEKGSSLCTTCHPDLMKINTFWRTLFDKTNIPPLLTDAATGLFDYFKEFDVCHISPQGSPEVFDCDNDYHRCFLRQWYKDLYVRLYNAIDKIDRDKKGPKSEPLLIDFEGKKFKIPSSLDELLVPYDPEASQQRSSAAHNQWSLEEILKALDEQPSSSKKKPKQKAATPKETPETQAAAAAATPARVPQKTSSGAQASAVLLPPLFVHKNIHPGYTQTAKLWTEDPDKVITQYGYLNENPTTPDQKIHRKIFQEMLTKYGQKARSMLIANHTVPTIVDEYMLDFEPTKHDQDWLITAPLYRVNPDGTTDEGIYELLYKKNKKKLTIYHKLFRPMNHQEFVAKAFAEGETKPFTLDDAPSIKDWENVWHPVSGEWNMDIKPPYYLAFSRPGTQESYYLLKHPLIMPVQQ